MAGFTMPEMDVIRKRACRFPTPRVRASLTGTWRVRVAFRVSPTPGRRPKSAT